MERMLELARESAGLCPASNGLEKHESEDSPPDDKPFIIAPLHGTKFVRGTKVATTNAIRGRTVLSRLVSLPSDSRSFVVRLWSFFRAITGGKVNAKIHQGRQAVCGKCPKRIIVPVTKTVRPTKSKPVKVVIEKSYCGPCNCPKWYLSRLDNKNWFAKWKCPLRRHAGPYSDDAVRSWLIENGHATDEQLEADGGGCAGCGGK